MNVSEPTVVDRKSFSREVCVDMLVNKSEETLDLVGVVVEIEESKFGKRKYNRGKRVDGLVGQTLRVPCVTGSIGMQEMEEGWNPAALYPLTALGECFLGCTEELSLDR
ncbi:hypothetical protein AVEN_173373-1 [Araneus ventricosus]|uniref:Uncharacterized protein n=1 Tax=Araneus ventricosus TaxID=182803 RepID=A0A4Y2NH60_ARAVE|nr:hypothetical protein AVEN_173373-1 [Araneus ventricosus]